jgi:hypothetical protein
VPLLYLINGFHCITIEHDKGHVERMGIREGGNQNECTERKDEEKEKGILWGDEACRDWPCPEYTPIFCEPAEFCIPAVIFTVDIIIQYKSPLESKETNEQNPDKI